MTAPGGGEPYQDQSASRQHYRHPPVDPQEPLDYPEYPQPTPHPGQQPPFGYPPTPPYGSYGSPGGYGYPAPPIYPSSYDPYQPYPPSTNGLAVASLITAIAGVLLGVPLAIFCLIGWLIPVAAAAMGAVALNQINGTNQAGKGLAIAGVVVGSATAALLLLFMTMYAAAMMHVPVFIR